MEGKLDFTTAFKQRLEAIGLTRAILKEFLEKNPVRITPGAE